MLDVVIVRIRSPSGKFLVRVQKVMPDGAAVQKHQLPGGIQKHESIIDSAKNVIADTFGIASHALEVVRCPEADFEKEAMSVSYPGLWCIFNMETVDARVVSTDPSWGEKIGQPFDKQFMTGNPSKGYEEYQWLSV